MLEKVVEGGRKEEENGCMELEYCKVRNEWKMKMTIG